MKDLKNNIKDYIEDRYIAYLSLPFIIFLIIYPKEGMDLLQFTLFMLLGYTSLNIVTFIYFVNNKNKN